MITTISKSRMIPDATGCPSHIVGDQALAAATDVMFCATAFYTALWKDHVYDGCILSRLNGYACAGGIGRSKLS